MKNIKILMLLFCCIGTFNASIYASEKYYESEKFDKYEDDQSTDTNLTDDSSYANDNDEIIVGFFIEKPSLSWKTKHFKNPIIVRAETFYDERGRSRLQVIEIPESIYFNYMPEGSSKDFIACDGPVRELTFDEYQIYVQEYAPEYYERIQRRADFNSGQ